MCLKTPPKQKQKQNKKTAIAMSVEILGYIHPLKLSTDVALYV